MELLVVKLLVYRVLEVPKVLLDRPALHTQDNFLKVRRALLEWVNLVPLATLGTILTPALALKFMLIL
jgi:hypothetical protein